MQQQIEDLQKSLQEQGSKSEGESVSTLKVILILLRGHSVIGPNAQINPAFESATFIIDDTLEYRIYLHNRCSDFCQLGPYELVICIGSSW